ncbi:MAG: thermonuclease family protein [Calditrichia bacterium]
MELSLYRYKANVVSVYDGDTVRVDIDLGLKTWVKNESIRLARINAPELRGDERPEGILSRDFLREQILGKEIILETIKDSKGKYGRYIGEIWLETNGEWKNINDLLVSSGYAQYAEY